MSGATIATLGNANLALFLAAGVAIWLYAWHRKPSPGGVATLVETSLMSGGLIIPITAAGGAFGAMLQSAQVGPAIESLFAGHHESGLLYIGLAFTVASLIKIAQGSSTVAMITTAGIRTHTQGRHAALIASLSEPPGAGMPPGPS